MRTLSLLTLAIAACLPMQALAACLDAAPAIAERNFMHAKQSYRAELCLLPGSYKGVADIGHGLMQLNLFRVSDQAGQQESLAAQLIEAVDVEGQLRELTLDRANYVLHAEIPTVAVLIKSRDRGVEHDQYLNDLQLYMPQAVTHATGQTQTLIRVASINTAREAWGTQCGKDCQDTIHSKTLVIVGSKTHNGHRELQLRTMSQQQAGGQGKKEHSKHNSVLRWNGQTYEGP